MRKKQNSIQWLNLNVSHFTIHFTQVVFWGVLLIARHLMFQFRLQSYFLLTKDVNSTNIRRSQDLLGVFWTFYIRSIYIPCSIYIPGVCSLIFTSFPAFCLLLSLNLFLGLVSDYDNQTSFFVLPKFAKLNIIFALP